MKDSKIYLKIIVNLLLTMIGVVLLITLLPKAIGFFLPFVIGGIISMIANPLVRFMEKRVKIVRKHGSAIIIVTVIAVVIGVLYLMFWLVAREIGNLLKDMDELIVQAETIVETLSARMYTIYQMLPQSIKSMFGAFNPSLGEYILEFLRNVELPSISAASGYVKGIADGLLMIVFSILSAYFFTAQRDVIEAWMKKVIPSGVLAGYHLIIDNFKAAVGGYFKAQFKIMLILAAIMFIGFELLKVNYSFLLAIGISFLDFLPLFGTGAILWPWIIIDIIMGNYMRALFLGIIYLLCQVIKQLLQPKMVGDSIGISPLETLIFMFIGYQVKGLLGLILGIPTGMVLVNFYRLGMFDRIIRGLKIIITDINEFRKF